LAQEVATVSVVFLAIIWTCQRLSDLQVHAAVGIQGFAVKRFRRETSICLDLPSPKP